MVSLGWSRERSSLKPYRTGFATDYLTQGAIAFMKTQLRKLFAPLLNLFEKGTGEYAYKPSFRKILLAVGCLFLVISSGSLYVAIRAAIWGGLLPGIVFFTVSIVCLIVGFLGSDRAVAQIWKSK
ncbi:MULTISPECIES: hypothetical protein [unclassified Oceanobacter]|uniref:hypothetical protein n=1 Tax=unclassified Oceanobacter TaxID=2620260 RepID=UPI0026E37267|nr:MULTISPECIES: hypothetical protein [unclassified Oceanobacter]MDO6683252.1 hypothetical protein [Oceanobacter sp. 5_MG-2023]MDP2610228.1 hypothetical protein [Oceanobacter sp. 1_MG-2023]MDP2613494.1 hypothetical protein [Oceanobacter sp. 2_MG-2023]